MLSRVREFGDLRQSRSSKKDNLGQSFVSKGAFQTPRSEFGKASATSFKSEYVCINCINKNMSSNKRDHEHHRFITQQSRYNDLQRSRRVYEQQLTKSRQRKQAQDKRKLNDYNRSLIEDHQKHRQKQLRSRQNARLKEQEEAAQYQQMIEKEQARRQRQKELFRTQIMNQINQKHQKRLRQQMKQRYPEPLPQDDDWINSAKNKNRDKYRQQLQDQIKENQQRRQRQKHNTSMQDQRFLNDLLDSNSKKYHENELSIKRQLQEDALAFQQSKQAKRRQKEQKLQRQKMQALINQEFQEKQLHENEKMKNDRINRYKQDIERQIRENDQKRNKLRNADKMNYNSTIGLTQEEIERRLCGSCDKTYPKKYLTKVK